MSTLKGFLQPSIMDETTEVIISNRFKGEDGKPLPFKLRKIDQATADALLKRCRIQTKSNGQILESLDSSKYTNLLVLECVVEPNFKDKEICDYYKTADPALVPGRMLSVGEFAKLSNAILEFNDLDTNEKIENEVKN